MQNSLRHSLALVLYFVGFLAFAASGYLIWQHQQPLPHIQQTTTTPNATHQPVHIAVPSQNISAPITPAYITSGQWETSDHSVSLLANPEVITATTGTIVYGHNWESLFGNLKHAVIGDTIVLSYSDGSTKTFTVEHIQVVHPKEVAAVSQGELVLYTCTGFLDSKRLIVSATEVR